LGANRNVLGQTLRLDDQECSVVGVMPATFTFYPEQTELWSVITPNDPLVKKPDDLGIGIFARLRPGISMAAAQDELAVLHRNAHLGDRHGSETRASLYPLKQQFTWLASRTLTLSLIVLLRRSALSF